MGVYQDLEVWNKAIDLAVESYTISSSFPREERSGLISQMRRAATSVAANIAEGEGRYSNAEFVQFLRISRGSLLELETHFIIAQRLNYLTNTDLERLLSHSSEIGKMINGLIKSISRKQK